MTRRRVGKGKARVAAAKIKFDGHLASTADAQVDSRLLSLPWEIKTQIFSLLVGQAIHITGKTEYRPGVGFRARRLGPLEKVNKNKSRKDDSAGGRSKDISRLCGDRGIERNLANGYVKVPGTSLPDRKNTPEWYWKALMGEHWKCHDQRFEAAKTGGNVSMRGKSWVLGLLIVCKSLYAELIAYFHEITFVFTNIDIASQFFAGGIFPEPPLRLIRRLHLDFQPPANFFKFFEEASWQRIGWATGIVTSTCFTWLHFWETILASQARIEAARLCFHEPKITAPDQSADTTFVKYRFVKKKLGWDWLEVDERKILRPLTKLATTFDGAELCASTTVCLPCLDGRSENPLSHRGSHDDDEEPPDKPGNPTEKDGDKDREKKHFGKDEDVPFAKLVRCGKLRAAQDALLETDSEGEEDDDDDGVEVLITNTRLEDLEIYNSSSDEGKEQRRESDANISLSLPSQTILSSW